MTSEFLVFVVIEFSEALQWPPKPGKKSTRQTTAVQELMSSGAFLASARTERPGQLQLEFTSLDNAITSTGTFMLRSQVDGKTAFGARAGIACGEVFKVRGNQDPKPLMRAKWLAGMARETTVLLGSGAASLAKDLDLLPFAAEEFGEMFNMDQGATEAVFTLGHPHLPRPLLPDAEEFRKHNIPWGDEFFIGRSSEIESVLAGLESSRHVSIVGPSGNGKSILARRVALELITSTRDGVRYVDLSNVKGKSQIYARMFESLGISTEQLSKVDLDLVRRHFASRQHLILFDQCEGLAKELKPIVAALLETKGPMVLTTTTTKLGLERETTFRLARMIVPTRALHSIEEIDDWESCALLFDRLCRVRTIFEPTVEDAVLIGKIARALDGHPLAIVLAARNFRSESLSEIYQSIHDQQKSPGRKKIDQELASSIQWTLSQISEEARALLNWCSVFVSPWNRQELSSLRGVPARELADQIAELDDAGIIEEDHFEDGTTRFQVLPQIRSWIRGNLDSEGTWDIYCDRHVVSLLQRLAPSLEALGGPSESAHLERLDKAKDELAEVLRHLAESRESQKEFLDVLLDSWIYWYRRNHLQTIISLTQLAYERAPETELFYRARILMLESIFLTKTGDSGNSIKLLNECISIATRIEDPLLLAKAYSNLAIALWADLKPAEAIDAYQKAHTYATEASSNQVILTALSGQTAALIDLNQPEACMELMQSLKPLLISSEDIYDKWILHMGYAEIYCELKRYPRALVHIKKAIGAAVKLKDMSLVGRTYMWYSTILLGMYQLDEAVQLYGKSRWLLHETESAPYKVNETRLLELEGKLRGTMSTERFNRNLIEGQISL